MLQLVVPDMTCGHCEKAIRAALAGLSGIEQLEIDLPTKTLRIEGKVDPGAVRHTLVEAGYSPK
ncbi:heavy-metal-associated domain-containing protein [Ferrovibrio xuzhouensis]|uniref:Heavy-metal-associated domain-containing protein n=1 Tax=Ferrovibrio xuzhouensis TaxID=1576914 RepID=A0ABV7VBW7_9PROT